MIALLRLPHVLRVLLSSLIGRLPIGMGILAIPLTLRRAGLDYGFVGLAVGTLAVSGAVGGPLLGRLVDRVGQVRVLIPAALANGAGFGVLALAPGHRAAVLAGAILAGAATPPLEPCLRTLWPRLVPADRLERAYSMDSAAQELIFIGGPLAVAATVAVASPRAALWAGVALCLAGTLVMATSQPVRDWRPEHREAHWLGPLRSPGLVYLLSSLVGVGVASGTLNVLLVSYAERHRLAGGAATLLALNALGSLLGALAYGAVKWRGPAPRRLLALRIGMGVSYAALCLVPGPPAMMALMLVTGSFLAPALTVTFVLVGELAPPGTVTEAFAWLITLFTTGSAIGAAVTGFVLDHAGMGTAAATAVAGIAAGALVQLAGRRHLSGNPRNVPDSRAYLTRQP
jgi:MFS family permease